MSKGLPDDPRKFRRPYPLDITKDVPKPVTKWPKCEYCGMDIKGKAWQVAPGKYVCFRCHNE